MNRLSTESSPYLRQHADNPVDWYPWGDEAFEAARSADRPILLSVGYSSCHWCHVMAHESFEDPDTAALMNELFVNIKVDREERPDVDALYMSATQAMTGRGGWPMTVFMDPEGKPFYCGTYFPKQRRGGSPSFVELCQAIDDAWRHNRTELTEQADRVAEFLQRTTAVEVGDAEGATVDLAAITTELMRLAEPTWGGFGSAPKFPHSMALNFLLDRGQGGDNAALTHALLSLDAMAAGGMYDHLGGGFARYSTDDRWIVPHFEKMLYDNGLLIAPYLHAWQITHEPRWLQVVEETITYLARDLRQPGGGFASAEDADSLTAQGHSEEGAFYVWSVEELTATLGSEDGLLATNRYGATQAGNFEGSNILFRPIGKIERTAAETELRERLLVARSGRPRPGLDDKVLVEWNAYVISGLSEAGSAADRSDWIDLAEQAAEFLWNNLRDANDRWLRSWQAQAGARHLAYAQDYAALVDAFTRLYEATGARTWLDRAVKTAEGLLALFWDDSNTAVYTTGNDAPALLTRMEDLTDGATPSATSLAAVSLARLGSLTANHRWSDIARRLAERGAAAAQRSPLGFSHLLAALAWFEEETIEIVITGDRPDLVNEATSRWHPRAVLSWGDRLDNALWADRPDGFAFVCRGSQCELPVREPEQLRGLLR